jgi:putative ABC transport system permease protein
MLPWTRAPLLLLRQPGLLVAIVAGAFVAVLPAAAAPLFLSSARTATLHTQLDNTCAARAGFHVRSQVAFRDVVRNRSVTRLDPAAATAAYERRRAAVTREITATPGMAAPTTTLFAATAVDGGRRGGRDIGPLEGSQVWVVGRDGVTDRLTPLQGPDGTGVWIPRSLATTYGLGVGDELRFATFRPAPSNNGPPTDPAATPAPVRVAAVYADVTTFGTDEYWCTLQGLYGYRMGKELFDQTILSVIYTDVATMLRVGTASTLSSGNEYVDVPLADQRPTVPEAHVAAARVDDLRTRVLREYPSDGGWFRPDVITAVGRSADRSELVYDTLRDTTAPATVAGVLIGLVVVAAAAVYWVQRREREVRVLAAHGVGPPALAGKAVLEAGGALVAGAVVALAVAGALVRAFGPSPVLSGEAWPFALLAAAGTLVAVLATTAVGVALRVRRMTDVSPGRRRLPLRWLPWELLPAALAAVTWWMLGGGTSRSAVLGSVAHVPMRLVVVPVLGFLALVGLGARLGAWWIGRSAGRPADRAPRRPGVYLALRRIARPVAASVLLGAVTAVPVAMTGFGATVTDSIRLTLDAKAAVILGSETVASLERDVPVPPELAGRATPVLRLSRVLVGGFETDVLGIDPATFADGAFWSAQLPGPSLDALVAGLSTDRGAGVAYGALPAGTHDVHVFGERQFTVDVRTTRLLPGSQGSYPVLLVPRDALGPATRWSVPELWVRGDPATAAAAMARADVPVRAVARVADNYGDSLYEPVTYTFRYLIALNLFAGLVVAAGLLLYVEARTPVYRRGYVILRRLGLRRRAHAVALVLETALPMGAGLLFGLLLAAVATAATRSELDLVPGSPPGPLIAVPTGVLLTILAVVAAVAAASSAFAHVRTVRAKPGEVLRTV